MGGATALLSPRRVAAFVALSVAIAVYYATHESWFSPTLWGDLAWLCFVLIPAVFGLVWLVLPAWSLPVRYLLGVALGFGVAAVVLQSAGAGTVANFGKLGAMTFAAWCFLRFFEELSWVVLVAVIIPWVDSYSVWRGPTNTIVNKKPQVFDALSFAFPVPGSNDAARLGLPDLLFYGLFLGAAARWQLRTGWTWICLTAALGGTMALATRGYVGGLPGLPLLAVGVLLPNADLLWREVRRALARGGSARDRRPAPK